MFVKIAGEEQQDNKIIRPWNMSGFYKHIKEAIHLNRERRPIYGEWSGGKTVALSDRLILVEKLVLPFAWYFDLKAKKYNEQGIGIVRDDFLPMETSAPGLSIGTVEKVTIEMERQVEDKIKKVILGARKSKKLYRLYHLFCHYYQEFKEIESYHSIHLPMVSHLLESMIFVTKNGISYASLSNGKSKKLTLSLIKLHLLGLRFALDFDVKANAFHMAGIGILVNDLPKIFLPQDCKKY